MCCDKIGKYFSSVSLSWRLGLSTFLISLFTLAITLSILIHSYTRIAEKEYFSQLRGYMTELSMLLEEIQEHPSFKNSEIMPKWIHSELTNEHYTAMLISDKQELLDSSENFPFSYDTFMQLIPQDSGARFWKNDASSNYIIGKTTVYERGKITGYALVARDLKKEHNKKHKLMLISALVCLITSLIIALLSFVFSRATLFPIIKMTSYINSIEAKDLHKRLNLVNWPAELLPMVKSFDGMLNRLEDNFMRLNQFSSDLAHELRTPIHQMKIAVDVTLSKPRKTEEYIESLVFALENAEKLNKTVEDLLFIARAENGKTAIKKENVNLADLTEKVKDFFEDSLEENNINLDISKATGTLFADEKMLLRAFVNIVVNALRYVNKNGAIMVESEKTSSHFIISISNDGPPIEEKYLSLIHI